MNDNIKHPSHYVEGRKFEPKDVIRDWGLNFNLGNAVKYLARAGRKAELVEDLKKAQQYIQFEIEAIEAESKKATKPKSANLEKMRETLENGKGISKAVPKMGVIELEVPVGTPPEEIIKMAIKKIYGGK